MRDRDRGKDGTKANGVPDRDLPLPPPPDSKPPPEALIGSGTRSGKDSRAAGKDEKSMGKELRNTKPNTPLQAENGGKEGPKA